MISPKKRPFGLTSKNADNIRSVNYSHLHAQTFPNFPYTQYFGKVMGSRE